MGEPISLGVPEAFRRLEVSMQSQVSARCGRRRVTRGSGFTLIELLVVVAIIALLISILIPSLNAARQQAMSVKCLAHQRGLAQAALAFSLDHQGRFQLVTSEEGNVAADPYKTLFEYDEEGELLSWVVALAQYGGGAGYPRNSSWGIRANSFADARARQGQMNKQFELATCPADEVRVSTPFYPNGSQLADSTGGGMYWGYLSFGINEDVTGAQDGSSLLPPVGKYDKNRPEAWRMGQRSPFAGDRLEGRFDRAYDPSSLLLITDSGADSMDEATAAGAASISDPSSVASLVISALATGPLLSHAQDSWPQRVPTRRHPRGAVNVIFADFHGASVRPTGWRSASADASVQTPAGHNMQVRVSPYEITGPIRDLR